MNETVSTIKENYTETIELCKNGIHSNGFNFDKKNAFFAYIPF